MWALYSAHRRTVCRLPREIGISLVTLYPAIVNSERPFGTARPGSKPRGPWRVNDGLVSTRPAEPCQLDGQRDAPDWGGTDSCLRDLPVFQGPGVGALRLGSDGCTVGLGTVASGRGDFAAERRRGPVHGHAAHGHQFRGQRVDALLRGDRDCASGPGDWRGI